MKPYGVDDAIYDPDWYDRINTFDFDVPFYAGWAKQVEGKVLEICCGTGRLTVPLAKAGVDITGLDLSANMLDRAREKAREAGVDILFIRDDMRTFDLDSQFDMIFIPFNSLQGVFAWEDVVDALARVHQHLAPGGLFLLDVFNPSFRYMEDRAGKPVDLFQFNLDDGREVVIRETCTYVAADQVNRVTWYFDVSGEQFEAGLDVRCFFPRELDALISLCGFEILHKYGDFQRAPFISESLKQILVCRPG